MNINNWESKSSEYISWSGMKQRCRNKKNWAYNYYGGRGISFAKEWENFNIFIKDMGKKPTAKHTLDRIDPDGNYCKENCRWATRIEQSNNLRKNVKIDFKGKTLTPKQISQKTKLSIATVLRRNKKGIPLSKDKKNYKITQKDLKEILKLKAKKMRQIEIAKKFNLTQSGVSRIITKLK